MKNQTKILFSLVVLVSVFAVVSFVAQKTNLMAYMGGTTGEYDSGPPLPLPRGYIPPASSSPVYTPPPTLTPTPVRTIPTPAQVSPTPTRTVPSGVAPAVPTVRPAIVPTKEAKPSINAIEATAKENGLGNRVISVIRSWFKKIWGN